MTLFVPREVEETKAAKEEAYGPIVAEFEFNQVPQGGAPEFIRQGWLGVVLPLRPQLLDEYSGAQTYLDLLSGTIKENPDTTPVFGCDGIFALDELDRAEVVAYWHENGYGGETLMFRGYEGILKPLVSVEEPQDTDGLMRVSDPEKDGRPGAGFLVRKATGVQQ